MISAELFFYKDDTLLEDPVWNNSLREIMCVSIEKEKIYIIDTSGTLLKTFKTK